MPEVECSAVLFDLDGVLVDSTPCVSRVWRQWATEKGLDPDYVVHVAHGRRTIETVQTVAPHLDSEDAWAEIRWIEQHEIEDTEGLRRIPGALELIGALPPERWAVVTSGTRALATTRLAAGGVPMPRVMVPADEVTRGKPDPEPYLKGASLLRFASAECVVIEDAPSGIRAGHAAGMRVLAVPTTYAVEDLGEADVLLHGLADISVELRRSGSEVTGIRLRYPRAIRG